MKEKTTILEVYHPNNQIEKIEVLKYFTLKQDNHDYILYKPVTINMDKPTFIFSARLKETKDMISLMPIEDTYIKELLKNITEKYFNEAKNDGFK